MTKTRKDGSRGRTRIDYGDPEPRDPQAAIAWLWKFIDGAKTAGELYGRALVVIAAEQHASRLVVPGGQRMPASRWSSHKDLAAKALRKLAGPHLPASLTKLEQAVKRAHAAYEKAEAAQPRQRRRVDRRAARRPRVAARRARADRRPSMARPGGRAGGGIGPRTGAGHRKEPTDAAIERRPLTEAERDARRQRRPRAHRARRPRAADQRRLAALDPRPRHQRPVALQPAQPVADRAASATPAASPPPTSPASAPSSQLNRCVRKGERAIRILAPLAVKQRDDDGEETGEKRIFFRTVPVFDVSHDRPAPRRRARAALARPRSRSRATATRADRLPCSALARELGYRVETRGLPDAGPGGWCDPKRREIVVADGPANRQVRTLVPWRRCRFRGVGMGRSLAVSGGCGPCEWWVSEVGLGALSTRS